MKLEINYPILNYPILNYPILNYPIQHLATQLVCDNGGNTSLSFTFN